MSETFNLQVRNNMDQLKCGISCQRLSIYRYLIITIIITNNPNNGPIEVRDLMSETFNLQVRNNMDQLK
jgi:hypothetical protein